MSLEWVQVYRIKLYKLSSRLHASKNFHKRFFSLMHVKKNMSCLDFFSKMILILYHCRQNVCLRPFWRTTTSKSNSNDNSDCSHVYIGKSCLILRAIQSEWYIIQDGLCGIFAAAAVRVECLNWVYSAACNNPNRKMIFWTSNQFLLKMK